MTEDSLADTADVGLLARIWFHRNSQSTFPMLMLTREARRRLSAGLDPMSVVDKCRCVGRLWMAVTGAIRFPFFHKLRFLVHTTLDTGHLQIW